MRDYANREEKLRTPTLDEQHNATRVALERARDEAVAKIKDNPLWILHLKTTTQYQRPDNVLEFNPQRSN